MYMKSATKHGLILKKEAEKQKAASPADANAQHAFSPHKVQYPVRKRFN